MAVKVIAQVTDFNLDGNDWYFKVKAEDATNSGSNIDFGPYSKDATDINADLKADVKTYAINTWSTSFALGDTVRLVHQLSIL